MGMVVISLLPPILGAALGSPMWTIVVLLLLRTHGGVAKAAAFTAGVMTVRLLQGILFSYLFVPAEGAGGYAGPNLIASTLQAVVGIFLLISAVTAWRMEDDPDAPPPKWLTAINRVTPALALLAGMALMVISMKQWLFTFSAIATIDRAQLGQKGSVFAYLFFVLGAQSPMLTSVIGSAVAPAWSGKILEVMLGWLEHYKVKIAIIASLIFGAWFLWRGASGLLALGATVTAMSKSSAS